MDITFTVAGQSAVTLGSSAKPSSTVWGGLSDVAVDGELSVQVQAGIRSDRVQTIARKNRSRTMSFRAQKQCASESDAATLSATYEASLPSDNGTISYNGQTYTGAAIKRVSTRQIGRTVIAQYTIVY
jgi:hypothetical protein